MQSIQDSKPIKKRRVSLSSAKKKKEKKKKKRTIRASHPDHPSKPKQNRTKENGGVNAKTATTHRLVLKRIPSWRKAKKKKTSK
jgi:hypothetical protein